MYQISRAITIKCISKHIRIIYEYIGDNDSWHKMYSIYCALIRELIGFCNSQWRFRFTVICTQQRYNKRPLTKSKNSIYYFATELTGSKPWLALEGTFLLLNGLNYHSTFSNESSTMHCGNLIPSNPTSRSE